MQLNNSDKCIARGLAFISDSQLQNGAFASYCSQDKNSFSSSTPYRTSFFPSCIGLALQNINTNDSKTVKTKIYKWLLTQKSEGWSFNYWDSQYRVPAKRVYPDDLDDTFCALAFMYNLKPDYFTGDVFASIAHLLFATEIEEGGPYRTWLTTKQSDSSWQDVDLAVNANIALFLSGQHIELPKLTSYIETNINTKNLESSYYPDIYPPAYFISRSYTGNLTSIINDRILEKQGTDYWGSPHNAALCLSTLLANGYPARLLTAVYKYLIKSQRPDGSWPAGAFNIDLRNNGKPIYMGAPSLTTALCLEALNIYADSIKKRQRNTGNRNNNIKKYYSAVRNNVLVEVKSIKSPELKNNAARILKRILKRDKDMQIILLPYLIAGSANEGEIEDQVVRELSAISLWGWMAYTTYDDFIDEHPDRILLPTANLCMRRMLLKIIETLPKNHLFQAEAIQIIDYMDAANAWELANCRFSVEQGVLRLNKLPGYKNYWQLANRSLGHTISGLGVLYALGFESNSLQMQALRKFFKHYLIARQLNDEAHDWEEDLRAGHVNAVATKILRKRLQISPLKSLDLDKEMAELRSIMWENVIASMSKKINFHVDQARLSLNSLAADFNIEPLNRTLDPVEAAAKESLYRRNQAQDFIAAL